MESPIELQKHLTNIEKDYKHCKIWNVKCKKLWLRVKGRRLVKNLERYMNSQRT